MSTTVTFERINSKVLIKKVVNPPLDCEKSETYLVDGTANVRTEDRLNGYIIITDKVDQSADNGILIKTADISGLTFTDADDLIEQLATNFFFRVGGVDPADTALATDTFYTKVQIDAMKTPSNFVEGLIAASYGIEALPIGINVNSILNGTYTLIDGDWQYVVFYIDKETTFSGVGAVINTPQAAYTADNYNGFSLHSINPTTGAFTKLTETANDGNLWKATALTKVEKDWPTAQTLAAGLYAVGLMWSASATTTAPKIYIHSTTAVRLELLHAAALKLSGKIAAQTAVPSPASPASVTFDPNILGVYLK